MKHDNDMKILAALRQGHATSTAIAEATGTVERLVQLALVRMMDQGRVVRTKSASGYEWRVA